MKLRFAAMLLLPLSGAAWAESAAAPYVSVLGSYLRADYPGEIRNGYGLQSLYGLPLTPHLNLELGGYANRVTGGGRSGDTIFGGGADLQAFISDGSFSFFALAGAGANIDDVASKFRAAPYIDGGVGMLNRLTPNLAIRSEVRYFAIFNTSTGDGAGKTVLGDSRFNLGLQYSFGQVIPANYPLGKARPIAPPAPVAAPVQAPVAVDTDGDGVLDSADQCPQTPADTRVDANGCPLVAVAAPVVSSGDSDGDGVPDAKDKCPSTPKGLKVDADGCIVEQTVVLRAINFDTASDHLTDEAKLTLDLLARSMVLQKALSIEIVGHTDSLGPQSLNLQLSQKRAAAVKEYLVAHGVEPERLQSEGLGEFNPIASNNSESGRAKNRRVEFKVVNAPAK